MADVQLKLKTVSSEMARKFFAQLPLDFGQLLISVRNRFSVILTNGDVVPSPRCFPAGVARFLGSQYQSKLFVWTR